MSAGAPRVTFAGRIRSAMSHFVGERDVVLLACLMILMLGGQLYAVIHGMSQLLPFEFAVVVGTTIQVFIFVLEGGYAGKHAPVRRWLAILTFSAASAYFAFFTYYGFSAGDRDTAHGSDAAASLHSDLVATIYTPRQAEAQRLQRQAKVKYDQSDAEAEAGGLSGAVGYGPKARALRAEGNEFASQAAALTGILDDLRPYVEFDPVEIGAEKTYENDLRAWQLAPAEWRDGIEKPSRDAYVDAQAEIALLLPYYRVRDGDPGGILAMALALLVDVVGLVLASAIEKREIKRDERSVAARAAGGVKSVRQTIKTVGQALRSPVGHEDVQDPKRVLNLRIEGETHAAGFLDALYEHIDPETGELAYEKLRNHPNESYRRAARWTIDAFRAPGWVANPDEGMFVVPADYYQDVVSWVQGYILAELDHRDAETRSKVLAKAKNKPDDPVAAVLPIERRIRAVLPEPVKQDPDAVIRLMRQRATSAAAGATSQTPRVASTHLAPYSAIAAPPVVAATPTPTSAPAPTLAVSPVALRSLSRSTLVPDEPVVYTNGAGHAASSPMAFARGGHVRARPVLVEAPAVAIDAPALRVVTPLPDDPTVAPEPEPAPEPDPLDEPTAERPPPVFDPEPEPEIEELPAEALAVVDDEPEDLDATSPSFPVVAAPEPEPEPEPAAAPTPTFVPEFNEEDWEEKPTATRSVPRNRLRAATQDGSTGIRDDALRPGSVVRLMYLTRPIVSATSSDPHAPTLRAHLRGMAQEALARGGR